MCRHSSPSCSVTCVTMPTCTISCAGSKAKSFSEMSPTLVRTCFASADTSIWSMWKSIACGPGCISCAGVLPSTDAREREREREQRVAPQTHERRRRSSRGRDRFEAVRHSRTDDLSLVGVVGGELRAREEEDGAARGE